jgi:hypothetical protein
LMDEKSGWAGCNGGFVHDWQLRSPVGSLTSGLQADDDPSHWATDEERPESLPLNTYDTKNELPRNSVHGWMKVPLEIHHWICGTPYLETPVNP